MSFFLIPKDEFSTQALIPALEKFGRSTESTYLEYKGEVIHNLYSVNLDIIRFIELSIRNGGNNSFKFELYSQDKNSIVHKHKFPRTSKPKINIKKK